MSLKLEIMKNLSIIPDSVFNKIFFYYKNKYWPNFKNPKSFNEKINHIKLYSNNSLRKLVADRIKVREYVKEKAPECDLINILWSGETFTQKDYDNLPQRFVIKANHGSGMVLVINKEKDDFDTIYQETEKWKKLDYGKITRQFVYEDLPKTIIVEEFINFDSKVVPDYKFMCINGKIEFIQVDLDRFEDHSRNLYDGNFNRISGMLEYKQGEDLEKPKLFEEAKIIAKKLSEDFDFLRVDLYILGDIIYFGELTNTSGNGYDRFYPKELDYKYGFKIKFEKEFL